MFSSNSVDKKISTLGLIVILITACCCLAALAAVLIYPIIPMGFPLISTESRNNKSATPKHHPLQPGATRTPTRLPLNTLMPNQQFPDSKYMEGIKPSPTIQPDTSKGSSGLIPWDCRIIFSQFSKII